jgi:hypothetical protein
MRKHKEQTAPYTGVALTSEICLTLLSKKFPSQAPAYVYKRKNTCHSLLAAPIPIHLIHIHVVHIYISARKWLQWLSRIEQWLRQIMGLWYQNEVTWKSRQVYTKVSLTEKMSVECSFSASKHILMHSVMVRDECVSGVLVTSALPHNS